MTTYLIIDDEIIAHEIIEDYANNLPTLKLAKHCYNAFEAMEYLSRHKVDLIFLDINMPKISGFELLKSLAHPPKVVVTTAYQEFALEGYELDIVDYLLKPFSLNRFLKAVQKATQQEVKKSQTSQAVLPKNATIFLKTGKKHYQISITDILFIEAFGNYTKVITQQKTIVTFEKLSAYLDLLPNDQFIQVHKSFIVAIPKIEMIEQHKISIGEHRIPIGQTYRRNIVELLR